MSILMMMNDGGSGTSGCIQQPPRRHRDRPLPPCLCSSTNTRMQLMMPQTSIWTTLLVFLLLIQQPLLLQLPQQPHPQTCSYIYSLSERSIVYATHGRPQPPPQMMMDGDSFVFSTPQGWLLILGQVSDAWLWHPLTGETIVLPPIHNDHYIPVNCSCLLTHASAAHPDCAVVLPDVSNPLMWFCRVNGWSDQGWGQHTYDIGDYGLDLPEEFRTPSTPTKNVIPTVAALRGKLHFISTESGQHKMSIVDLNFPADHHAHSPAAEFYEFDVNKLEFPDGLCSASICFVESMDELFAICICYVDFNLANIGAIVVYKMNFCGKKPVAWHRVDDIGDDRAFLLTSMNMATWCSVSTSNNLKGNTLYFLRLLVDGDRDLCIYDIKEQTIEIVQVHDQQDLEIVRTTPYWINVPPC